MTARLALVMIVRDEARCLARCLDSIAPHVDRMIVVDTGSTDDTVAIAAARGAEVHHFEWVNDFSAARNAALDRSDADWNLILDADNWLDSGAEALGEATLPRAPMRAGFIGCARILNQRDDGLGVTQAFEARILPRGVRYQGRIHEQPATTLPLVRLPLTLGHDGYDHAQLARKAGRNESLLQEELAAQPHDGYLWYQLGREHLVRGDAGQAADCLLSAYRVSTPTDAFRHGIVVRAIQALKRAERFEDALALVDAEHPHWPASPDFYFAVAELYLDWASRNPGRAFDELLPVVEGAWKKCLEIGDRDEAHGSTPGCGSHLAAQNLAMFYDTLGIADEAARYGAMAQAMRDQADVRHAA